MPGWGRPRSCYCDICARCKRAAYMRAWYASKTFEERQAMRQGRDLELARKRDRERYARMKNDPSFAARRIAVAALNDAVRSGRITRQACEVCGAPAQAHHDDYAKPLEVRWLCTEHHALEHNPRLAA